MNDMTQITPTPIAAPSSPIIHHTLESFVASRKHVQGTDGGHYEYANDSSLVITKHNEVAGGHYLQLPNDDFVQGTVGDEYQGSREELERILYHDWYVGECTMVNDWNQETLTARFEAYCEYPWKRTDGVTYKKLPASLRHLEGTQVKLANLEPATVAEFNERVLEVTDGAYPVDTMGPVSL